MFSLLYKAHTQRAPFLCLNSRLGLMEAGLIGVVIVGLGGVGVRCCSWGSGRVAGVMASCLAGDLEHGVTKMDGVLLFSNANPRVGGGAEWELARTDGLGWEEKTKQCWY